MTPDCRHIEAYVHGARIGVLVEFCVESSFTLRMPEFARLAKDIAMHVAASAPKDLTALLEQPFVKDGNITIAEVLASAEAQFREKVTVLRFARWDTNENGNEPTSPPNAPAAVMRLRRAT